MTDEDLLDLPISSLKLKEDPKARALSGPWTYFLQGEKTFFYDASCRAARQCLEIGCEYPQD